MTDILLYGLALLMGAVLSRIFFREDTLDKNITDHLMNGKQVVISVDNDAYIFKMHGKKLRITRAAIEMMEEPYDNTNNLVSLHSDQPADSPKDESDNI